jgi:hypothetical protein
MEFELAAADVIARHGFERNHHANTRWLRRDGEELDGRCARGDATAAYGENRFGRTDTGWARADTAERDEHDGTRIEPEDLQPVANRALVGAGAIGWRADLGVRAVVCVAEGRQPVVGRVARPGRPQDDERDQRHGESP